MYIYRYICIQRDRDLQSAQEGRKRGRERKREERERVCEKDCQPETPGCSAHPLGTAKLDGTLSKKPLIRLSSSSVTGVLRGKEREGETER